MSGVVPRSSRSAAASRRLYFAAAKSASRASRKGDRYLRQLLIVGALAVVKYAQRNGTRRPWLVHLLARRTTKVATVALANKTARIVWAIMSTGATYREPELQAA